MSQTLQAALTVLGGVFVLVVGQVIVKFFIEPFQERAKLLGEIAGSLIYYANTTSAEARDVLRRQASQLMSTTNAIPMYSVWVLLSMGRLPGYENVNDASVELVGMSNQGSGEDMVRIKKIAKLLRIKVVAKRFGA